jgi:hypothetical protein
MFKDTLYFVMEQNSTYGVHQIRCLPLAEEGNGADFLKQSLSTDRFEKKEITSVSPASPDLNREKKSIKRHCEC